MTISREVLAKHLKPGDVFVEAGTRWGDSVIRAMDLGAGEAWTCEIDFLQWAIARTHVCDVLVKCSRPVHMFCATSKAFLTEICLSGDVVFLDAHTENCSPIIDEISAISMWVKKPRVILIDDIRLMESAWKIPLTSIRESLKGLGYAISFENGVEPGDIMVGMRL